MAARLTDRQKKRVIADYVESGNYSAVARKHGITRNAVKAIVQASPETAGICHQKKEQNTADVLAYMESRRDVVCEILGNGLEALRDPKKMQDATPPQIATALGILIDKWTALSFGAGDTAMEDELSQSLRELGEGLESDDQ